MPHGRILVEPDELRRAREHKRRALADAKAKKLEETPLVTGVVIHNELVLDGPLATFCYRKGTPKSLILRDVKDFLRIRGIRDGAVSIEEDWTE